MFLLDMGKPIRLLDLARQMVRLSGLREEDDSGPFIGLRPARSSTRSCRSLRDQLTEQPKLFRLVGPSRTPGRPGREDSDA